jgi:hypothetical protein
MKKPKAVLIATSGPKRWTNQPRLTAITITGDRISGAKMVTRYSEKGTVRVDDLIPGMKEVPMKLVHQQELVDQFDHPEQKNGLGRVEHMAEIVEELVKV